MVIISTTKMVDGFSYILFTICLNYKSNKCLINQRFIVTTRTTICSKSFFIVKASVFISNV